MIILRIAVVGVVVVVVAVVAVVIVFTLNRMSVSNAISLARRLSGRDHKMLESSEDRKNTHTYQEKSTQARRGHHPAPYPNTFTKVKFAATAAYCCPESCLD